MKMVKTKWHFKITNQMQKWCMPYFPSKAGHPAVCTWVPDVWPPCPRRRCWDTVSRPSPWWRGSVRLPAPSPRSAPAAWWAGPRRLRGRPPCLRTPAGGVVTSPPTRYTRRSWWSTPGAPEPTPATCSQHPGRDIMNIGLHLNLNVQYARITHLLFTLIFHCSPNHFSSGNVSFSCDIYHIVLKNNKHFFILYKSTSNLPLNWI